MNKAELIEAVAGRLGDRRTASTAVEAVLFTVQSTVTAGEKVALSGFGVFEKVDRAARTARNPATGAAVELAATSVPRFRPGQGFKDVVSGARELPEQGEAPPPAPRARAARSTTPVGEAAEPAGAASNGVGGPARTAGATAAAQADPSGPGAADAVTTVRVRQTDVKKADVKKADAKKADAKKADAKKADAKSVKKADAKKADAKKDGKKKSKK